METQISLKARQDALTNICDLMEYYKACKGESRFSKLISDVKYAALVSL